MKTKIVYISGSELFDMAQIRAAFDQVRGALSLTDDTVLFGVPVDNDDALPVADTVCNVTVSEPVVMPETDENNESITPVPEISENITPICEETVDVPVKKTRRTRSRSVSDVVVSETVAVETVIAPIVDDVTTDVTDVVDNDRADDATPVVPITSILSVVSPVVADDVPVASEPDVADIIVSDIPDVVPVLDDIIVPTDIAHVDTVPVTIDDVVADDAPVASVEKTLEELLESMTPLREDHGEEMSHFDDMSEDDNVTDDAVDTTDAGDDDRDDTDITLERLATEFAENQDNIVAPAPTEARGKIGKLKNILPFKKVRRDDGGLMGDLFGWAGIAANDEEFAIPGFFANASAKK